jgi:hypothetical protein
MLLIKKILLVLIVCMATIIILNIVLSLNQKFLEIKITKLNKEIYINRGEYQNLKAEWNYLNNKAYLRYLSAKYLPQMGEYKPANPIIIDKIPLR